MPPQALLVLTRLDQVRALADPLRFRLVQALVHEELSVSGLADAVGAPVTRLYHHVQLLLDAGLIEEAGRVRRRGVEERIYRAAAREFRMDGSLLEMDAGEGRSTESLVKLARSVLGGALEQLTEGLRSGAVRPGRSGRGLILQEQELNLTAAGFEALAKELPLWLDQFVRRHGKKRGKKDYRLVFAAWRGHETREE
jgi:DNA-binding transcriptional ArsR family regulator